MRHRSTEFCENCFSSFSVILQTNKQTNKQTQMNTFFFRGNNCNVDVKTFNHFTGATLCVSAIIAVVRCLSVCLSVCLSHWWSVSTRLKISSNVLFGKVVLSVSRGTLSQARREHSRRNRPICGCWHRAHHRKKFYALRCIASAAESNHLQLFAVFSAAAGNFSVKFYAFMRLCDYLTYT